MKVKHATEIKYGCERPTINKYTKLGVPCGQCGTCIKKKRGAWFLRLGHELRYSSSAYFVTLTYHDKCLPRVRGRPTLKRADLNKFLKTIRRRQDKLTSKHEIRQEKIRFFGCGEYGDNFGRPHYHVLLFNVLPDVISRVNTDWSYGVAQVGEITPRRMMYTTKYMLKGSKFVDGRERHFVRMSTGRERPSGIGGEWLKNNAEFLKENDMLMVPNLNGDLQFLPRYYRNYIWEEEIEREAVLVKWMGKYAEALEKENSRLTRLYDSVDDWIWSTKQDRNRRFEKQLKTKSIL